MTNEAKRCVEALRICHSNEDCRDCEFVDSDKDEMSCVNVLFVKSADLIESLSAELEQVKRERDVAVRDIYDMKACALCKHYPDGTECETYFLLCIECDNTDCICKGCINGERLEWRGVKEG